MACARMLAAERVEDFAAELDVAAYEPDELASAQRRIKRDLKTELEMVKAASALFNGEQVIRPRRSSQSFKG